ASGTYMRSIAHDMGQKMGCGAHLACLRRTEVAEFGLAEACTLEALGLATAKGSVEDLLVHPRRILPDFPCLTANQEMASRIRTGKTVNLPDLSRARQVKVFEGQKVLLAIATRIAGTLFHPRIVLAGNTAVAASR